MTKPTWWPRDIPQLTDNQLSNFWTRVQYKGQNKCWIWTGGQERHGYGRFSLGKSNYWRFAHRVSWTLVYGPVPNGLCVLHHCDVPLCVNPTHLFLGTQANNIRDCMQKGRQNHIRGMANSSSKLTDAQVVEIRKRCIKFSPIDGVRALGREFGVDHSVISEIVAGKKWKHLL